MASRRALRWPNPKSGIESGAVGAQAPTSETQSTEYPNQHRPHPAGAAPLLEDVFQSYQSWRAHAKRCNSYDTLRAMDERFTRMFAEELAGRRKPFPCTMKATRTGCGWIYRRHGAVIEEEMCA